MPRQWPGEQVQTRRVRQVHKHGSDFLQLDVGDAPTGGLSDWLAQRLRLAMADGRLPAALARGVKVQPLSWHSQRPGSQGLVMGYAARTPAEIGEGVAILGDLLRL
ncbi:hypothetical protein ACFXJ8_10490 [Nonomuraea sp. NPDC059194]|uniref:hypothetical protein n=1 Tax=Nonomuraea sp. NPDC059194 TaxID=3346764 RepID=UPI00367A1000